MEKKEKKKNNSSFYFYWLKGRKEGVKLSVYKKCHFFQA